ncbi:MAG: RAD55 family ATPase [Methanosarcinales archaeon]
MTENVKTGIEGLDALFEGSLKSGSFCLVIGPSFSGTEVLIQQYFYNGLELNEGAIYVTTKYFTEDVIGIMQERGFDITKYPDKYRFIDAYAPQADPSLQDTDKIRYVPAIADIPRFSSALLYTMSGFTSFGFSKQRLSFDSIDALLMHVSPLGVYRFLSYLRAKMRGFKSTGFFLIQPDLHEEKTIKIIMQLVDVTIQLDHDNKEILVFQSGKETKKAKYKVSEKGFEVEMRKTLPL